MRLIARFSRTGRALGRWGAAACLLALFLPVAVAHAPLPHHHGPQAPAILADAVVGDGCCPAAEGSPHWPCLSCPLHLCCALPLDDVPPAIMAGGATAWPEPPSGTPRQVDPLLRPPRGGLAG
jgi:hypothetical protein